MFRKAVGLIASVLLLACAPEFEPVSEISSLRIMAVRKDTPYARPGDTVRLSMLLAQGRDDSEEEASEPDDVEIRWLGGCENPAGDLYAGCFADFTEGFGSDEGVQAGAGIDFTLNISKDIISRRPPPVDPSQPPYGLAYVFFAACAGELRETEPGDGELFPLGCYSKAGERLDADSFVAGYTSIFVFESISNSNPEVQYFTINGERAEPECINNECLPLIREELGIGPSYLGLLPPRPGQGDGGMGAESDAAGALDAGAALEGGLLADSGIRDAGLIDAGAADSGASGVQPCSPPGPACLDACPAEGKCPEYEISLIVDPDSAEVDEVARARGDAIEEQMWINYYVEAGELDAQVTLLNDATTGFIEDHATDFTVPREARTFRIWAVAHDNRGGTSWARLKVQTRTR